MSHFGLECTVCMSDFWLLRNTEIFRQTHDLTRQTRIQFFFEEKKVPIWEMSLKYARIENSINVRLGVVRKWRHACFETFSLLRFYVLLSQILHSKGVSYWYKLRSSRETLTSFLLYTIESSYVKITNRASGNQEMALLERTGQCSSGIWTHLT